MEGVEIHCKPIRNKKTQPLRLVLNVLRVSSVQKRSYFTSCSKSDYTQQYLHGGQWLVPYAWPITAAYLGLLGVNLGRQLRLDPIVIVQTQSSFQDINLVTTNHSHLIRSYQLSQPNPVVVFSHIPDTTHTV